jgi:hypothetical protein
MFRRTIFEPMLTGQSYSMSIEGLKSPVTKAALPKYMKYLNINNPDDIVRYQDNPKFIQNQIIQYLILLKNPPHSLSYATRSQYLAAIMTFYDLNEVAMVKNELSHLLWFKKTRSKKFE